MSFVDRVVVEVHGGGGGDGASSFARFKFKAKGGPDGGDGGNGGSVYVRAEANFATLLDYRYRTSWKAERGGHGKGKNMTGPSRDDVIMPVPPGTLIIDDATGETLGEVMLYAKQRLLKSEPNDEHRVLIDALAAAVSPAANMLEEERREQCSDPRCSHRHAEHHVPARRNQVLELTVLHPMIDRTQ